jgi:hypothetical protein
MMRGGVFERKDSRFLSLGLSDFCLCHVFPCTRQTSSFFRILATHNAVCASDSTSRGFACGPQHSQTNSALTRPDSSPFPMPPSLRPLVAVDARVRAGRSPGGGEARTAARQEREEDLLRLPRCVQLRGAFRRAEGFAARGEITRQGQRAPPPSRAAAHTCTRPL